MPVPVMQVKCQGGCCLEGGVAVLLVDLCNVSQTLWRQLLVEGRDVGLELLHIGGAKDAGGNKPPGLCGWQDKVWGKCGRSCGNRWHPDGFINCVKCCSWCVLLQR